ncbi:transcriptional regulator [Cenarchaeum symbiosum A]|uniref:Transcriptional regulator n=1 Tax=Cenarchaeum symbiosum (strain A) TaxID=414004 RepID=A0RWC8_CENSY|nr:transcriptional regulator [Cenarchaeum symbiosum A]
MRITDRTRKALTSIGLTGYEIRAYMELLRSGGMTASEISQRSGVSYSKIYEVLGSLEEKGWTSSDDSRPTRYTAKSPATGLETAKQRIDSEFSGNSGVITGELAPLYEKSGTSEKPDIWFLSGTVNIAAKVLEMVETCRNEVLVAVPEAGEELIKQAMPKLRYLHDRGVDITVLTSDKMDAEAIKALGRISAVKIKKGLFGGGIISDRRYVVILLGHEMGGAPSSETVAIWADHAGLAGFAREYFEYLLKEARAV